MQRFSISLLKFLLGENAPIPPVFGPCVVVVNPLVILRGRHQPQGIPVGKTKHRNLGAGQILFNDHLRAGSCRTLCPSIAAFTACSASSTVIATVTPFPSASPSAFITIGAPLSRI